MLARRTGSESGEKGLSGLPGSAREHRSRSEEHTSELQSHVNLVCRLLLEKKKRTDNESGGSKLVGGVRLDGGCGAGGVGGCGVGIGAGVGADDGGVVQVMAGVGEVGTAAG